MAGQVTRAVGEVLYLQAQLYDFEASLPKRVIADVVIEDGSILSTVELTHTSKGMFVNNLAIMPDEPVLFVKYYVYESDGTTLSVDHGQAEDRYMRSVSGTIVIGDPILGVVLDDEDFSGIVYDSEIIGEIIIESELSGSLYDDTILEGVVYEC